MQKKTLNLNQNLKSKSLYIPSKVNIFKPSLGSSREQLPYYSQ